MNFIPKIIPDQVINSYPDLTKMDIISCSFGKKTYADNRPSMIIPKDMMDVNFSNGEADR